METYSSSKTQSWLLWFIKGVLIFGFLILLARLVELQVIKGAYYRLLSEGNRVRRVPIVAARGNILARNGEILVGNREVKRRVMFNPESGYEKVDDITGADESELISEWLRDYKIGLQTAHVSGYIGEVNKGEVGKIKAECPEKGPYRAGSWVGRSGLEEEYECLLSGINGEELVEVDSQGKKVRILGRKEPVPGLDVKTTIDYFLQKKVSETLAGQKGVVIVSSGNGEILALYSSPSYDPNIFVRKGKDEQVVDVLDDENLPLFNRAIGGKYHPGSTYKPVVALAALEEKIIDAKYRYNDTGKVVVKTMYGDFSYANWYFTQYGGVEGEVDLTRAIARSTDTFFYEVGEMLGVERMVEWSGKIGLDKKTGIDLPGEIAGFVPSPGWKKTVKGERWFLGNTYHMSIGQGDLAITPMALNAAIMTIATDGQKCTPSLVGVGDCGDLHIRKRNTDLIKEGMREACQNGGTGHTFFDFSEKSGVEIACKTGTAETGETSEPHAWFVAFGPVDEPEIFVTVLVENGGEGSKVAGPIAREIFDYWFEVGDSLLIPTKPVQDE